MRKGHGTEKAVIVNGAAGTAPETAAPAERRLDELCSGTRARVRQIERPDGAMARLMAMGLCVGRELEVLRQGNPLVVRLLGARIGLSRRLARRILVERSAR